MKENTGKIDYKIAQMLLFVWSKNGFNIIFIRT